MNNWFDQMAKRIADMKTPHDNYHPLWNGPCDHGPLGGITQSMISRFLSCRERFRLKYVCGLEPHPKWNHRIGYGNMWHVCEEAHAGGKDWVVALLDHTRQMTNNHPLQREEIHKWHKVCEVQFPEYVDYWKRHPDTKNRTPIFQEQVFCVPYQLKASKRTVYLRGKWDSVDLLTETCPACNGRKTFVEGGCAGNCACCAGKGVLRRIYIQENKTKSDIDKERIERQLSFDLQSMVYMIALLEYQKMIGQQKGRVAGYSQQDLQMGYRVCGVRYNVVRRPLSGGKGNIRPHAAKSTKGVYTPAESESDFFERLRKDYIASEPDYWFFRVRAEISTRDVEVFKETCLDPLLEQICDWYAETTGQASYHPVGAMNYRTPFGIYSALEDDGATEYDAYLATGSEVGLRRSTELFPELK